MERGLIESIAQRLSTGEPSQKGTWFAAVSVIFRGADSPSVLLIRRAEHPGDPWSGQIAFPGGKSQPEDRTAKDTAVREALEEVGFDLDGKAEFLGYGPLAATHTGSMEVVPSVFALHGDVEVRLNKEVSSYRWVPVGDLLAPEAKTTHRLELGVGTVDVPAYTVGDYIVWGLTHRILGSLLEGSRLRSLR